ncbi:threonine/serine exporter family protein [Clostridium polynesiense]|uniref:threonine/serine exporter family protein n=1 Tax=Clostridium polynesiense TaxID=1325933 RepID=UPI00058C414C|nr:threonine/serine exporter family protein [Clostridium polynesiense]
MFYSCIYSFIASFGFGIIFNIRRKNLFYASLGGVISWYVYSVLLNSGINNLASLLISSIVFSSYSEIMARISKTPVTTYIICSLIPLVPGSGMYYTMYDVVQGNINKAVETGVNTIASAGSLAVGILLVSTVVRLINHIKLKKNTF